jgi:flavodoxin
MKRKVLIASAFLAFVIIGWFAWSAFNVPHQKDMRVFPKAERIDLGNTLVAFYSLTGTTKEIAGRIAEMTGGTLFEIETEKNYPASPMLYYSVWREQKSGALPELKKITGDYSSFDVIFVGSPVWFYTLSSPIRAFLSQCDFQGKIVVPFSTQGGKFGDFFTRFEKEARNAKIAAAMDFSRSTVKDISALDQKMAAWLNDLRGNLPRKPEISSSDRAGNNL